MASSPVRALLLLLGYLGAGALGQSNATCEPFFIDTASGRQAYDIDPRGERFKIVNGVRGVRLPRDSRKYITAGGCLAGPQRRDPVANFPLSGRMLSLTIDLGGRLLPGCVVSLFTFSGNVTRQAGPWQDAAGPQLDLFVLDSYRALHRSRACAEPWNASKCEVNSALDYAFDGAGEEFGPGPQFAIDTLKPFRITIAFHASQRRIQTVYFQEGRRIRRASAEYPEDLWQPLVRGRSLALSYLSGTGQGDNERCPSDILLSDLAAGACIWRPRSSIGLGATFRIALACVGIFVLASVGLIFRRHRWARPLLSDSAHAVLRLPRSSALLQPVSEV